MMLGTLRQWADAGWLRPLDSALAGLLASLQPQTHPNVLLAAALLAQVEGHGHSCLDLDALCAQPGRLLPWPQVALDALDATRAVWPAGAASWAAVLRSSSVVDTDDGLGAEEAATGSAPLVLRGHRLFLRRYWRHERDVAAQVLHRTQGLESVALEPARAWLDRLFDAPASPPAGPDWQKVACALALRGRLVVITGGPGTGKTYTAARLLALLLATSDDPSRLRVALAAPTGKAAARLGQSIGYALQDLQRRVGSALPLASLLERIGPARTLHALLGARPDTRFFRADAAHPLPVDVLIVDEASMVHLEMMAALMLALPPTARLVLLGDKDQLASVEAGAVLGDLCSGADLGRYTADTAQYVQAVSGIQLPQDPLANATPLAQQTVQLRSSHRFGGPIGQLATAANAGNAAAAMAVFTAAARGGDSSVAWLPDATAPGAVQLALHGRPGGVPGFAGQGSHLQVLAERPVASGDPALDCHAFNAWALRLLAAFDRCRMLCALRDTAWGAVAMNLAIERALAGAGLLHRNGPWYEGRPVMVTRNDAGLGVFNGDIGIVVRGEPKPAGGGGHAAAVPLRVVFSDGQQVRTVAASRLAFVETAFAMTVHKSQGSEFAHTVLVLPEVSNQALTRELVYTGITRARQALTLVSGTRQVLADALARRTVRASGLPELLRAAAPRPAGN